MPGSTVVDVVICDHDHMCSCSYYGNVNPNRNRKQQGNRKTTTLNVKTSRREQTGIPSGDIYIMSNAALGI